MNLDIDADRPIAPVVVTRTRPLRVCHLAYTFYETDNRVMRYADAMTERGDEVDVIALRRAGQSRQGDVRGVRVFRIQRRTVTERAPWTYLLKILSFFVRSFILLGVRHLRKPYDIVHVHNVPDFLVFAAAVPRWHGSRVILDIHDVLPELYAGKFGTAADSALFRMLLRVERLSCRFSDHVVVANHLWHGRLTQRSIASDRCTTILNYPDLRIFKPLRRENARNDGKFIMLYPGTLNRHQALDFAIRAFARVRDQMPNAEFHIYGEGPARPELEQLTREYRLDDSVKFMDPLPIERIAQVMAAADLGVEPKHGTTFANEALSTKILEFMACGVPVIVSRTQVHAHYFDESVVRFFVPGREDDLARGLVEMRERPSSRMDRIRAQEFADSYSWQRRVDDYYGLVDRVHQRAAARAQIESPQEKSLS